MSKSGKAVILPVVLCATMALTTRARAQASAVDMAAAACPVNENTPRAVQEASVMIIEALNAKADSAKKIPLRSAGKVSVPAAPGAADSAGRAYELGRVLVLWLDMENQPVVTSKGSIGFVSAPGDTAQKIDLSVWIDSTFKIVEKAIPSCAPSLAADWRQHPGWFRLVQRAVQQAHDGKFDSASVTVTQASRIYSKYPYTAFVQAQVAAAHGDHATATAKFNEVIALSQQDSAYDHIRAAAQAGLAAAGAPAGSAATAPVSYKAVLNNPSASYADVMSAGLAASGAQQMPDAIRLFRRAVEMNPYQRDALNDLGMLLTTADSNAAARPFVDRLLQVDPSNPNNYVLAQQVYASLQRGAQRLSSRDSTQAVALAADAGRSKAYRDSSTAWADSARALGTASMNLLNRKDAITVGIQFSQWIPKDGSVTLGGVLTNTAAAAKTVKLHVDFLDKGGNTVSSNEVTLTVDPKRSTPFTLTGNGAGIAAFKYTPLT